MTVRVRLTLIAVLVVGLALVAGSFALVTMLSSVLTDQVCADARERASQLATRLGAGGEAVPSTTNELIQVIDADGKVVGGAPRYADPGGRCLAVEPPGRGEDFSFAAAVVPRSSGSADGQAAAEVIVGRPLVDVLDSTRFVTRVLLVGLPLMLVVVGGVTWIVAGRVLAPVAAIRREVDEISAAELQRRVPAPRGKDEIGRLAATMNRMLDRLQRSQESQQRFVSDASHELRSPIASIRQHAEVALAHPERSSLAELADTVLAENLRIQRLVDDLLLLAKADEQDPRSPRTPVDLDDLVLAEVRRSATGKVIDTSSVSAGQVLGDEAALRRVILNLYENAVRYARSRIVVSLAERDGEVVFTIADDGPGIPAEDRDRVFERFVRLGSARGRDDGGSGLGLAIVAEVVRAHGGTVHVHDTPLGGATLAVRLPTAHPTALRPKNSAP